MKYENDFTRVSNVLQSDKSVMSEGCKALILHDFAEKLGEYFDLTGLPKMLLSRNDGKYFIRLEFEAERIKKFNVLK